MWSREDSRRSVITGSDVSDDVIKHDLVSAIELNITHYFSTKRNICGQNNMGFIAFKFKNRPEAVKPKARGAELLFG